MEIVIVGLGLIGGSIAKALKLNTPHRVLGMDISDKIAEPVLITLQEDGTVSGDIAGSWTFEDQSCFMSLTYGGTTYSGVFCRMQDEAGTDVMTFSAAGNNKSVWGAKYE